MTTPLSDSTLAIAQRFFEILDLNKATLGIQDVWFGDQDNVPRTPSVCVEPGVKRRELQGIPDMTLNTIDTFFLVYHSPVGETQQARRDTIQFAEGIERYLHINHLNLFAADGSQLTIHGFCSDMDPGYAYKGSTSPGRGTLYNAVQITWTSTTKTRLRE